MNEDDGLPGPMIYGEGDAYLTVGVEVIHEYEREGLEDIASPAGTYATITVWEQPPDDEARPDEPPLTTCHLDRVEAIALARALERIAEDLPWPAD